MSRAPSSGRASWLASPPPVVAVEIATGRVTAVAVAPQGGGLVVAAHASEVLDPAWAVPSLNAPNVLDERALAAVLDRVLGVVGAGPRKIALVLPDSVAKVSLVRFEKVPARAQDLEQLLRWQVRKAAPFRIEDAQLSWQPGLSLPDGGREYLVVLARRDIVRSYERACELAGAHAGLIDLASFNLINTVLASGAIDGDWLLVNLAPDYSTLAVVRGGEVVFFRNRSTGEEGELADLVHQTAMYHEDRLGGGGFARVILSGAWAVGAQTAERFRVMLQDRIGVPVQPIDPTAAAPLRDRIAAGQELRDALAAPVGILARERAPRRTARGAEVA